VAQTSAQRKFARGVKQVERLRREADAFEHRDAYVFRPEIESRSSHNITYRCLAIEREPPPDEWSLLAGEAIQNLRSALDHVIWASIKRPSTRTAFPIFTDPREFQVLGTPMLRGVSDSIRAAVEKAQPYRTFPDAPAEAFLERLRVLSNLDKHRTLATIASAVQHEGVGVSEGVNIAWQKYATDQPLGSGETHISTFTASSESELREMDVQPFFAYEVRIEGRPVDTLVGIVHEVYRVLFECETGKPLPPLAPYPL
jgi:hypothetical protein